MRLKKDPRTGVYKAVVRTADGKTRTISTKCTDKKEARRVASESGIKELEMAARSGGLSQQVISRILVGQKLTVQKVIDQWAEWRRLSGKSPNTVANQTLYVRTWAKEADVLHIPPSSVTEVHIHEWLNDPSGSSKAKSRRFKLAAIRSFFMFCKEKGWTLGNPANLVSVNMNAMTHEQKEATKRVPFTDEEVARLLTVTSPGTFWFSAIVIARHTGLRLGDICQLEWASVEGEGGIVVWTDKRDKRVELPEGPEEVRKVLEVIPKRHSIYCFPEQREIIRDPKRRAKLSMQFQRLCKRAGIHGKSFHCLRHQYATECMTNGLPVPQIAKRLGHSSETTTQGYLGSSEEEGAAEE